MTAPSKPQVFIFETGFLFSSPGMVSLGTQRYSGTLLLAASAQPFELEVDGRRRRESVALLRPFFVRNLHAQHAPLVSLGISPNHPKYRAFSALAEPGCLGLDRSIFPQLQAPLHEVQAGGMGFAACERVFEQCIEAVTAVLPPLGPLDARVERVMRLLEQDHHRSTEELGASVCLSYFHLSHLFSKAMGLTLRQYMLALKIRAACRHLKSGMNLTDTAHAAGFTDSAHLSRVWVKAFGGPPSYFLNRNSVSVQPGREATGQASKAAA